MERSIRDTLGQAHSVGYEPASSAWHVDNLKATAVPQFLTDREREADLWALGIPAQSRGAQTWRMFVFRKGDLERLWHELHAAAD